MQHMKTRCLNQILTQLEDADISVVPDKTDLMDFIMSITHNGSQTGARDMVDLLKLVKMPLLPSKNGWFKFVEICFASRFEFV